MLITNRRFALRAPVLVSGWVHLRDSYARLLPNGVLLIGFGSMLATLFAMAMIFLGLLEKFGVSAELLTGTGLLAVCLLSFVWVLRIAVLGFLDVSLSEAPSENVSFSLPLAACFLIFCLVFVYKIAIFRIAPAAAWDTLDYWAPEAVSFIASYRTMSQDFSSSYLHPYFSYMSLPTLIWATQDYSSMWLHGVIPVFLTGLLIIGFCLQAGNLRSVCLTITVLFVFLSLALVENHTFLVGYIDLWMASATLLGACWVYLALRSGGGSSVALAVFYCFNIIWWRNDWPVYLAPLVLATLFSITFAGRKFALVACIMLLTLSALIVWSVFTSVIVDLTRLDLGHYGFDSSGEAVLLWMGKRNIELSFQNICGASAAFMEALVYNSSFSTLLVASLASISTLCFRGVNRDPETVFVLTLPFFTLMAFGLAAVLSNHFSEGYTSAGRGDVGLSRFLLSWSVQVILAVGLVSQLRSFLFEPHSKKHRWSKNQVARKVRILSQ